MRLSPIAFSCVLLPGVVLADDFTLNSRVSAATVFPQGASLTRVAMVDLPAGRHRVILSDMPMIDPSGLRLSAPGVTIGAVNYRDDFVPPREAEADARIARAEAEVDAREDALAQAQSAVAAIVAEADSARAQIGFLDGLGRSDGVAQATPDQLRALLDLVGQEGLTARRAVAEAEERARVAQRDVVAAQEALARAQQALRAVMTAQKDRAYLVVDVMADAAYQGAMTLSYTTDAASWTPTYDLRLTTAAEGREDALTMERGAYVRQSTGENWRDVALTLSTVQPSGQTAPGDVWPWLRRIFDPEAMPRPVPMIQRAAKGEAALADMAVSAPMVEEVQAAASFDGISVTYRYPDAVSVANAADAVKLALGSVDFTPEVFARAVPLSDSVAYLSAAFTNTSGELILGSGDARFYLNGTFVGQRYLDLIAEGDEAELAFGPIEGLRLERMVLDRQEGDRGVISKSNEQNEAVEITLRNLTDRDWAVRLRDRVPYSEQEDLEITWQADPTVSESDVDGRRGVLEWRFDMDARSDRVVQLNTRLRWPDGQVLQ